MLHLCCSLWHSHTVGLRVSFTLFAHHVFLLVLRSIFIHSDYYVIYSLLSLHYATHKRTFFHFMFHSVKAHLRNAPYSRGTFYYLTTLLLKELYLTFAVYTYSPKLANWPQSSLSDLQCGRFWFERFLGR